MALDWLRKAETRIEKAEESFQQAQGYYNGGDYDSASWEADNSVNLFRKARFAALNADCKVTKNRVKLGILKAKDLREKAFEKTVKVYTCNFED